MMNMRVRRMIMIKLLLMMTQIACVMSIMITKMMETMFMSVMVMMCDGGGLWL